MIVAKEHKFNTEVLYINKLTFRPNLTQTVCW